MRSALSGKPCWLALSKQLTITAIIAFLLLSPSNAADTDAEPNTEVDYMPVPNGCLQAARSIAATAAWVIAIVPGDDPNRDSGKFFVSDPVPLGRLSVAECADTCAIKKNTTLFAIFPSSDSPDSTAGCACLKKRPNVPSLLSCNLECPLGESSDWPCGNVSPTNSSVVNGYAFYSIKEITKSRPVPSVSPSPTTPRNFIGNQPISRTTTTDITTTTSNPSLQTSSVESSKPTATARTVTAAAALVLPNQGAAFQVSNAAAQPATTTRAGSNPSSEQSNAAGIDPNLISSAGGGVNEGTSDGAKPDVGGNSLALPLAISVPLLFLVGLLTVTLMRRRRPTQSAKGRSLEEANPSNRRVSFPAGLPPPPRAIARVRSEDLMGSVYSIPFSGTESVTSSIRFSNAFTFFQGGTLRSEGSEERLSERGSFRHSPQTPGSLSLRRAEEPEDPAEIAGPEPPPIRRAYTGLVSNLVVVSPSPTSPVMIGHYGSTPEILSTDKH
ncbi:hypothetical protein BJ742DRAFT_804508 [Cladochytrium replicatum]|nr:hypothetical protein BJ742DRAFT_804508 [Cladochytrium replicatum]